LEVIVPQLYNQARENWEWKYERESESEWERERVSEWEQNEIWNIISSNWIFILYWTEFWL
jgi:hypothetical protein